MQKAALHTASAIFTLVAIAHAIRLIARLEIIVDGTVVPMWVSVAGLAVAALLALWMIMAARRA